MNRKVSGPLVWILGLALLASAVALVHVFLGSSSSTSPFRLNLSFDTVARALASGPYGDEASTVMVWELRLPRAIACLCVGGALGAVGSLFQAILRNPLAEPYVIGASSGSAVGGATAILLGLSVFAGGLGMIALSVIGGWAALSLVLALATQRNYVDSQRILLCGVVVGSMLMSVVSFLLIIGGHDSNQILRWLLGSMTPMFWQAIPGLAISLILGVATCTFLAPQLNALAMGEETAQRLGVSVQSLRPILLFIGTTMTAMTVGAVGIIGFLGMVAPHIARRLVGADFRWSLPASALTGMVLLCGADILAQWLVPGIEVPVGIVTALIGSPVLLVLIRAESGHPNGLESVP